VVDGLGMLEVYSEVDKSLADLNGNTADFRLSEDLAFLEGMNQQMAADALLRQHRREPRALHGARPALQHGDLGHRAERGERDRRRRHGLDQHVHLGGGVGSEHDALPLPEGPDLRPAAPGSGRVDAHRCESNQYQGYRTHFKWDMGFTLRDWRYAVRIANIDVNASSATGAAANLINGLIRAVHRLPTAPRAVSNVQTTTRRTIAMSMGRTVIYCNR
jgi:hypothetical protein